LLAVVFLANGLLMFGFKLFARVLPEAYPASLIAAIYGCAALLAAAWAGRGLAAPRSAEIGCGLGAGVASALAGLAMLGAMSLPAAAAFPVIQGVSLLGGVVLCALFFRERLTPRKLAALAVGVVVLLLTRWR
jgi:drug/metabolite transporter (DMT)-like permease